MEATRVSHASTSAHTRIGRGTVRKVFGVLAAAALMVGIAEPASAATGAPRFTVVFAGPEGQPGRVFATGVVNAVGSNPASLGEQVLVFPQGDQVLSTEFTGGSGGFNPLSCVGRGTSNGTFVVTGGTGQFASATGSGTFTGSGTTIARRLPEGGCSESDVNRYSVVNITGSISL